jgi:DNA-binding beta-propeller fold protein YncE
MLLPRAYSTAEAVAHPSGQFVFGSNRGYDSIVTFAVDRKTAKVTETAQQREGLRTPPSFGVDPTGQFLLAANQSDQAAGIDSPLNLIAATMPSKTKLIRTTSWVSKNGGSDWVGAIAFSAGTFEKACAIKTKTLK